MPTYRIHHLTRYTYEEPVSICHNLAHLLPRKAPRHLWHSADLDISPAPAIRAERRDYFGNRVTFFAIQEPHRELSVTARARVDIQPSTTPAPLFTSLPWEMVRDRIRSNRSSMLEAFEYTFDSPYIRWTPEVTDYAHQSFSPGRPIMDAVIDLTKRIYTDFEYNPDSTTISTTLPEILHARAGVCQDFAHLQIGCLRSLGLPARYVSGYLLTSPPPGQPRLTGADASHAWLAIHVPDMGQDGWIDVDPTNNLFPSDKHMTLAWGRDFGDVSPLRGVILGGRRHTIHVSVDVAPVS